jgi:hypothetical protein
MENLLIHWGFSHLVSIFQGMFFMKFYHLYFSIVITLQCERECSFFVSFLLVDFMLSFFSILVPFFFHLLNAILVFFYYFLSVNQCRLVNIFLWAILY